MMYRPEIKVLDCTIRDGGLINKWQFSDELVRETYKAVADSGVDYMEIGYKAAKDQFDPKEHGKWRFCDDEVVKNLLDGIELGYNVKHANGLFYQGLQLEAEDVIETQLEKYGL